MMAANWQPRCSAESALQIIVDGEDDSDEEPDDVSDAEEDYVTEEEVSSEEEGHYEEVAEGPAPAAFSDQQNFVSADGMQWRQSPPVENPHGRQQQHNIIREGSGVSQQCAEQAVTPLGALHCFITLQMMNIIVQCTNEEGNRVFGENWNPTTVGELKTYLGLLILAGVYRGCQEPVVHLWNLSSGRPIFNKAMSRNRFQQLTRTLRFDIRDIERSVVNVTSLHHYSTFMTSLLLGVGQSTNLVSKSA